MEQPTRAKSWVQVPQHQSWGFDEPRPELVKIVIDLRSKEHQPTYHPAPEAAYGPSLSSILAHHQQAKVSDSDWPESLNVSIANSQQNLEVGRQQSTLSDVPELFVCLLPSALLFLRMLIVESAKRKSTTRLVPGREL